MSFITIDGVQRELTSEDIAFALNVIQSTEYGPKPPGVHWFSFLKEWLGERIEAYAVKEKLEAGRAEQDALRGEAAEAAFVIWSTNGGSTDNAMRRALANYELKRV